MSGMAMLSGDGVTAHRGRFGSGRPACRSVGHVRDRRPHERERTGAADAQVTHNAVVITIDPPDAGEVRLMTHPVRYDAKAPPVRLLPPRLGERTREVLGEWGSSAVEIDALIDEGAVFARNGNGA